MCRSRELADEVSPQRSCRPSCSAMRSLRSLCATPAAPCCRCWRVTTCVPPAPRASSERTVIIKHAMRNALMPVITLGALEFGTLAVGRGAHRTDLHDSGLRQADRRCRLQSRLRGRSGRRAGHGDNLYFAQSPRRYRLYPCRSAVAWLNDGRHRLLAQRRVKDDEPPKHRFAVRCDGFSVARAPCSGCAIIVLSGRYRGICAADLTPYDPIVQSWTRCASRPRRCTGSVPTISVATFWSRVIFGARASLMAGVIISVGIAVCRSACRRTCRRLSRWLSSSIIGRLTDAMLACPSSFWRSRWPRFSAQSREAMIAIGVTTTPIFVRLTRGQVMSVKVENYIEAARAVGNPRWRIALVHILPNILPAAAGADYTVDCGRDHRRSRAFLPGSRPAAASALLGQHAQLRRSAFSSTSPGWPFGPGAGDFSRRSVIFQSGRATG